MPSDNFSISREMIKAAPWNLFSTIVNYAGLLFNILLLAWFLQPEEYGIAAVAMSITAFFVVLTQFGFAQAIVGLNNSDKSFLDTLFTVSMLCAAIFYVFLIVISYPLAVWYGNALLPSLIIVSGLGIFCSLAVAIPLAILQKSLNYKAQAIVVLFSAGGSLCSVIVLAVANFGVWALILPPVIGNAIGGMSAFVSSRYRPSISFRFQELKKAMNFGVSALISNISNFVCGNLVPIVLGKIWSPIALGFYDFAERQYSKPFDIIGSQLGGTIFPIFSKIADNIGRMRNAYLRILRLSFFIIPPIYIILIFGAPIIFLLIYGSKWESAIVLFQIFCILPIFRTFSVGANGILYALKLPHISARVVIFRAIGYLTMVFFGFFFQIDVRHTIALIVVIDSITSVVYFIMSLLVVKCGFKEIIAFLKAPFALNMVMLFFILLFEYISQFFLSINMISSAIIIFLSLLVYILSGYRIIKREFIYLRSYFKNNQ